MKVVWLICGLSVAFGNKIKSQICQENEFACQIFDFDNENQFANFLLFPDEKVAKMDNFEFYKDLMENLQLDDLNLISDQKNIWALKNLAKKWPIGIFSSNQNLTLKNVQNTGIFWISSNISILDLQNRHPKSTWIVNDLNLLQNFTQILPNSNIFYWVQNGSQILIYEVYKTKIDGELIQNPWGFWTMKNGFFKTKQDKWERRKDLTGVEIIATANDNHPMTYTFPKNGKNGEITIGGYVADIWTPIQKALNFTTKFVPSKVNLDSAKFQNLIEAAEGHLRIRIAFYVETILAMKESTP